MARFVNAEGEHRAYPGAKPVNIRPMTYGHPTMSFRGQTCSLVKEGSRTYVDLPDQLTPGEIDQLLSHGFIAESMLTTGMVEDAVKAATGTVDLKAAIEQEKATRAAQTVTGVQQAPAASAEVLPGGENAPAKKKP